MDLETNGDGGSDGLELSEQSAKVHIELKLRAMTGPRARHLAKQTSRVRLQGHKAHESGRDYQLTLAQSYSRSGKAKQKP